MDSVIAKQRHYFHQSQNQKGKKLGSYDAGGGFLAGTVGSSSASQYLMGCFDVNAVSRVQGLRDGTVASTMRSPVDYI
jgi:hypothetical protein